MSEVLDKIKSRRSIRKYRSDMIPQDKLEKIIEAGTYAATGIGKTVSDHHCCNEQRTS